MNFEDLKRLFNEFVETCEDSDPEYYLDRGNVKMVFDEFVNWVEHKGRYNIVKESLENLLLTEEDITNI